MRRIKNLTSILIVVIFTSFSFESKSQTFEGKIVYRVTIELPKDIKIPIEQFKKMYQDLDTIANFYLKNCNYKLVTFDAKTNAPKTVTQYDSESNITYSYMADQNDFCMTSKAIIDSLSKPLISKNIEDALIILGKKCYSITIDYGQINKTTIYFSDDYKVDTEAYKNNPIGFIEYIYRTGALPLKIIISGNGAEHHMVFTAIEVKQETIKDKEFEVPKFKQLMDSPF